MIKYFIIFTLGSTMYPLLEILWRGYSHFSMALAGGIGFLTLFFLSKKFKNVNLIEKSLYGAISITIIELIFGIIFNIILKMNVWDYSSYPINFLGQICLEYFILWTFLSLVLFPICRAIETKIFSVYFKNIK